MKKNRVVITKKEEEDKILETLKRIAKNYRFNGLSAQEKARFKKAQFAREQAKKTPFVFGEPIVH
ncbi:hypothetical protein ACFL2L_01500 [Patescibacteria group bacterium]